jgi:RNA polymerase sigma-70 factor (ECF subfamily)
MSTKPLLDYAALDEIELARLCSVRDAGASRHLITANNQRLFRAAWSILRDRGEAEDAVQAGYLSAFGAIGRFEGRSSLSTWLTRIVINEALARQRAGRRRRKQLEDRGVAMLDDYRAAFARGSDPSQPDAAAARVQLRALLEDAIAKLPEQFRTVFVLREIEGLSVEETAQVLGLIEGTVKTRLLRARRKLQDMLAPEIHSALTGTFPFAGADCAALTERVLAELGVA